MTIWTWFILGGLALLTSLAATLGVAAILGSIS